MAGPTTRTSDVMAGDGARRSANDAGSQIKVGPGLLRFVTITVKGVGANLWTLSDGAGGPGTVLAVIDTTTPGTYWIEKAFTSGLWFVGAGGTGAADGIIAVY